VKEQISFSRKFHGSGFAITHARLADRDWANTGHDLAFRQMAMAHNASAVRGLEIGMLGEKIRDLGLYGLSQQRARPLPQDFGELIVKGSWLNQLEHVTWTRHIAPSMEKWRLQAPPRYAALPIRAVTNFRR